MTHSLCRKYICLLIIHCHINHVTMYNLRLHSFLHINAERQVNVTKTLNDNVNSITPNVFVKLLFKQIPVILRQKPVIYYVAALVLKAVIILIAVHRLTFLLPMPKVYHIVELIVPRFLNNHII